MAHNETKPTISSHRTELWQSQSLRLLFFHSKKLAGLTLADYLCFGKISNGYFVGVTPAVAVLCFVAAHDGMVGFFEVSGSVFVLGVVTATDMAADHAET